MKTSSFTSLPQPLVATVEEFRATGWERPDIVLVGPDAYVDHPSFPLALLGRVLQSAGFRVCLLDRPLPLEPQVMKTFGLPRLFFGVSGGAIDSMVANYTALKKPRSDDPYGPDGAAGGRPDRAVTVYGNLIRQAYGKAAFILAGGIEASLRRFAHYDYWSNKVRRSLLMDCGADALVFGMAERSLVAVARRLDALQQENLDLRQARFEARPTDPEIQRQAISDIPGLVTRHAKSIAAPSSFIQLPSADEVASSPETQAKAFMLFERHAQQGQWQDNGSMRVVAMPPDAPLSTSELDELYALPFTRRPHPKYSGYRIPALDVVRFGVTSHRGCYGGCSFCAIGLHQGKVISSRSEASVLAEIDVFAQHPDFSGVVQDVGGPSANMYGSLCRNQEPCPRPSCLWPTPCPKLNDAQSRYLRLLERASKHPKVKHLFVTTGLRLEMLRQHPALFDRIVRYHTSGHLKVAPEHHSSHVLELMRKPAGEQFADFLTEHRQRCRAIGSRQKVVPYFIAAHPGSTLEDMIHVALFLRQQGLQVEQAQIFTPTPSTSSTVMYATGLNPATLKPVFVERDAQRKRMQKAFLLAHVEEQWPWVRKALDQCGKAELFQTLTGKSPGRKTSKHQEVRASIRPKGKTKTNRSGRAMKPKRGNNKRR